MAVTVNGTNIVFNDATTQTTAWTGAYTPTTAQVLSATAGLSFNAVGSYAFVFTYFAASQTVTSGSNYSAGSGSLQMQAAVLYTDLCGSSPRPPQGVNSLSGTWKWLAGTFGAFGTSQLGIAIRVA